MLKKLKKHNQTAIELEKFAKPNENNVEAVPKTRLDNVIGVKTSLNESRPDIACSKENLFHTNSDKLQNILSDGETNKCNRSDINHADTRSEENADENLVMGEGPKAVKRKPFAEIQKGADILVTDALRKIRKKTTTHNISKEKRTVQFVSNLNELNSCTLASQGSVIIDKQLSVTKAYNKIKCVYTILNSEQINMLRKHAQKAVKHKKIFTIRGNYNSVRVALKTRGWVEKLEMHRNLRPMSGTQGHNCDLTQVIPKRQTGESQLQFIAKVEKNIMSRCIDNVMCDFLWTPHKEKADHLEQHRNPNMLINKFNRAPFTNKENLNTFLRDMPNFYEEHVADINFPRCFNVWSAEELSDFIDNFKLTACKAFIQWLVDKYNANGFDAVFSPTGKIPHNAIEFAYKRCVEYMDACEHNDIDHGNPPRIWEHEWDSFLHQHYQITNDGFKIQGEHEKLVIPIIIKGSQILDQIQNYWPQHSIDGYQNLWIIKPANRSRGRGIHLFNNLKKIINFINPSIAAKTRLVVQKYMERPLIIHHTKFDIRQWFLISSINPLTIWMYNECYLRFSTQEYTLENHHESVHLTNHAIQKKYTNNNKRDKRLPHENMWDSYTFQAYLKQIGKQKFWTERIYPGMRKAIVAAILVSQNHMERTTNTFELFGADFMICENFYPWLIEINSNPDLASSTSVTARMCPQCLEDVLKVIIDRRRDPKADVGNFELIYRQNLPPTPAYMGLNLVVKGKQITNRSITNTSNNNVCQRKDITQHMHQLFKQRNYTTTTITNVSAVQRPMPAFNATEYVEKDMIEDTTKDSSRSKSVSAISVISEQTAKTMMRITSIHRRSRSFNNQIMAHNRAKVSATNNTHASLVSSIQNRYRSSGPRLSTNSLADFKDAPKSKLLFASHNQQKLIKNAKTSKSNNLLDTSLLIISKSADNIKELCSPIKTTLQCSNSLSPILPLKNNINNYGFKAKATQENNNTATIHAIGIGLSNWRTNKGQSGMKTND